MAVVPDLLGHDSVEGSSFGTERIAAVFAVSTWDDRIEPAEATRDPTLAFPNGRSPYHRNHEAQAPVVSWIATSYSTTL
jgi:hypothetical protein